MQLDSVECNCATGVRSFRRRSAYQPPPTPQVPQLYPPFAIRAPFCSCHRVHFPGAPHSMVQVTAWSSPEQRQRQGHPSPPSAWRRSRSRRPAPRSRSVRGRGPRRPFRCCASFPADCTAWRIGFAGNGRCIRFTLGYATQSVGRTKTGMARRPVWIFFFFLPLVWIGFHPVAVTTALALNLFFIHTKLIRDGAWNGCSYTSASPRSGLLQIGLRRMDDDVSRCMHIS